jgi:hypothetical protein
MEEHQLSSCIRWIEKMNGIVRTYVVGKQVLGSVGCVVVVALEAASARWAGTGEFGL